MVIWKVMSRCWDDIRLMTLGEIIFQMRMCCSLNQMVVSHFHLQSYIHFLSLWGLLTLTQILFISCFN